MGGKCYQQFAKVLILCYIPGYIRAARSRRVELGLTGRGRHKGLSDRRQQEGRG